MTTLKKMKFIGAFLVAILLLSSCYKEGKIIVVNRISNVRVKAISWGDVVVSGNLLPGEQVERTIPKGTEKLPQEYALKFTMEAKSKEVALETVTLHAIQEGETKTIVLDDDTEVSN